MERFHGLITTEDGTTITGDAVLDDEVLEVAREGEALGRWRVSELKARLIDEEIAEVVTPEETFRLSTVDAERLVGLISPPSPLAREVERARRERFRNVLRPTTERRYGPSLVGMVLFWVAVLVVVVALVIVATT